MAGCASRGNRRDWARRDVRLHRSHPARAVSQTRGTERVEDDLDTHRMPDVVHEARAGILSFLALLPALLGLVARTAIVWFAPDHRRRGQRGGGRGLHCNLRPGCGVHPRVFALSLGFRSSLSAGGNQSAPSARRLFERRILPFTRDRTLGRARDAAARSLVRARAVRVSVTSHRRTGAASQARRGCSSACSPSRLPWWSGPTAGAVRRER